MNGRTQLRERVLPANPARRSLLVAAAAACIARPLHGQDRPPVIAVASDLQFAVAEIVAAFTAKTGKRVEVALGSTGNFATQIRNGAPFEMFMAADETFIADLHAEGFTRDAGTLYAKGRLVIMVPHGSALKPDATLDTLSEMIDAGTLTKFAIANPDHAPYGMRAAEVLRRKGLWDKIQPHIVLGENVSQAAQFALSGNADGGIIAYSLALAPKVAPLGTFGLIDESWHQPLQQRMALMKDAGPVSEAFYAYMQSSTARAVMVKYGFALPGGG